MEGIRGERIGEERREEVPAISPQSVTAPVHEANTGEQTDLYSFCKGLLNRICLSLLGDVSFSSENNLSELDHHSEKKQKYFQKSKIVINNEPPVNYAERGLASLVRRYQAGRLMKSK